MNLFTKQRVVKMSSVKVSKPFLVDSNADNFEWLYNTIPVAVSLQTEDCEASFVEQATEISPEEQAIKIANEANQILLDAEEKAQLILLQAQEEAHKIKENALLEIEALKIKVQEETRQEILPIVQQEAQERIKEAENIFYLAEKTLAKELANVDEELLNLSIKISERILRAHLAIEPNYLLFIMKALIQLPQQQEDVKLRISTKDAAWVNLLTDKSLIPYPILVDEALAQGDVLLEHGQGLLDARLESQLNKLQQILQEELVNVKMG